LIVFQNENLKKQSLNDLAISLKVNDGIDIKRQSLHDRFNDYALIFLKNVLEKLLQKQFSNNRLLKGYEGFKRILLKDSICFQIDKSMADSYPGRGGNATGAAVRIQFEYNLLDGRINDLSVNPYNDQDAKNSLETIELSEEGDLIIRDLAYMSRKVLKSLTELCAFFLCRVSPSVNVYVEKKGEFVKEDFTKVTNYMKKNHIASMEKEVYLGKEKLKVRLILHLLPEEEIAKRLKKAKRKIQRKGFKKLSNENKARMSLNLFITNAFECSISQKDVWPLYRLRWQIELIFKVWKSICEIEKVKKVNKKRLECYIFSKLIFIVLGWQMMWAIAKRLFAMETKALSFYKAFKTLYRNKIYEMQDALISGRKAVEKFLLNFYDISTTYHLLEKKQQRNTPLEILTNFFNGAVTI